MLTLVNMFLQIPAPQAGAGQQIGIGACLSPSTDALALIFDNANET